MIRIRNAAGNASLVPEGKAVEVLDSKGHLLLAVLPRGSDSCKLVTKGDPEFNAYCKQTGLVAAAAHVHHPTKT